MKKTTPTYPRFTRLALAAGMVLTLGSLPATELMAQKKEGSARTGATRRAQQKKEAERSDRIITQPQAAEEPTDLAIRLLTDSTNTGNERKAASMPPPALTALQLTRLRVADERIGNVIPFRGYPLTERLPVEQRNIYADAAGGLYSTARIAAGYSGESWPYDYSLSGRYLSTAGDPDNSAARNLAATLAGGYVIGDSYGIFSGGHMGARVHYESGQYNLYALPDAPERDLSRTEIGLSGGNTWRTIRFDTRGSYRSLELQDSTGAAERSIDGSLAVSQKFAEITVGGAADVRWTVSRDSSISFAELGAYARYTFPALTVQGGGAVIVAGESGGETLVRLAPRAEARLYLANAITATAAITGGITQNTLSSLLRTNPYTSASSPIRHDIATIGYSAGIRIEPTRSFAFTAELRNTEYSQYAWFAGQTMGTFVPQYDRATIGSVDATFFWKIGENDELAALATYTRGTLGTSSRAVPYLPALVTEGSYRKRLAAMPLTLVTHLRYIGEREGAAGTTYDGVMLAGVEGRYELTPHFDVALEFQNLMNSRYELWDGYRERGIFAALGIKSRF